MNNLNKPNTLTKTLLLIVLYTPALSIAYQQGANVWVIIVLFAIIVSQAFNLTTLTLQSEHILLRSNTNVPENMDKLYQNQLMLKDNVNVLNTANKNLANDIKAIHENMKELKTTSNALIT